MEGGEFDLGLGSTTGFNIVEGNNLWAWPAIYLKETDLGRYVRPAVQDGGSSALIDDHRDAHGIEPICKALPIAPSTYHVAKRIHEIPVQTRCTWKARTSCRPSRSGQRPKWRENPQPHPLNVGSAASFNPDPLDRHYGLGLSPMCHIFVVSSQRIPEGSCISAACPEKSCARTRSMIREPKPFRAGGPSGGPPLSTQLK